MREKIAEIQHKIWAHWMEYLFSVSHKNPDGSLTIPSEKVVQWQRLIQTDYKNLTEQEKESDRNQADKVLEELQ